MDTVSSATLSMMETPLRRSKSSVASGGSDSVVGAVGGPAIVELDGVALTVPYFITVGLSASARDELQQLVDDCFKHVENVFSPFHPGSELCTVVNGPLVGDDRRDDGAPNWVAISPEMFDVLAICDALFDTSSGTFDPTAVSLGKWYVSECKRRNVDALPEDDQELLQRRARVGWRENVSLRRDVSGQCWLRKAHSTVHIDPTAVSKGWCVDHIVDEMQRCLLVMDAYVDWGGDIRVAGRHPEGREWCAGVQNPLMVAAHEAKEAEPAKYDDETVAKVTLTADGGCALCTSGDYNSVQHLDYHHMTDAQRGIPMRQAACASVSVVTHRSCAVADGCATVLLLLQSDAAMKSFVARFNEEFSARLQRVGRDTWAPDAVADIPEHIHRHVALMRPPTGATGANCSVLLRFSPWLNPPIATNAAAQQRALSADDAAKLRTVMHAVPRNVFVFIVSSRRTPTSTADNSEGVSRTAHFACTMTSPLALGTDAVLVFAMRKSLVGETMLRVKRAELGGDDVTFSIVCSLGSMSLEATETADKLGRGAVMTHDELERHPILGRASGRVQPCAVAREGIFLVGDHVAFAATLVAPATAGIATSAAGGTVMRSRRSYESIAVPRGLAPSVLPPRVVCLATVTMKDASGKASTLGTVLRGFDLASQSPMILTALCSNNKLNRKCFLPNVAADTDIAKQRHAVPCPPSIGVRVHLLTAGHDAKAVVDWFGDGNATDAASQFMYHPAPDSRRLEEVGGVPIVPYLFSATAAWIDVRPICVSFPSSRGDGAAESLSSAGPMLVQYNVVRVGGGRDDLDRSVARLEYAFN